MSTTILISIVLLYIHNIHIGLCFVQACEGDTKVGIHVRERIKFLKSESVYYLLLFQYATNNQLCFSSQTKLYHKTLKKAIYISYIQGVNSLSRISCQTSLEMCQ